MKNRGLVDYIEVQDLAQWKAIEYLTIDSVNDRLINMFGEDAFHKDELFFVKKDKSKDIEVKIIKYISKDDDLFIIDGDIYTEYILDEIKQVNYSEDYISFFCNKDFNYEFKIDKIAYKQNKINENRHYLENLNNKDGWEYNKHYRSFTNINVDNKLNWEDFWDIKSRTLENEYINKISELEEDFKNEMSIDIKIKRL